MAVTLAYTRHTESGDGESASPAAELTVTAPGGRIPAAELGRMVARFHETSCADPSDAAAAEPAAIRVVGGDLTARSGLVAGRSSREASSLQARWLLPTVGRSETIRLP